MDFVTAPADSADGASLPAALHRLAEVADALGAERAREDALALARRSAEGLFYVACVGQFKRGKSTLLNALLGRRVLPAGVLPITSVPTVVRYGRSLRARILFQPGGSTPQWTDVPPGALAQYVSEELNPENKKRVAGVEMFFPSPLLERGMCLVDTPGLGSIFSANSDSTNAFIPRIDVAIVVLGADPPIGADELVLVDKIARHVSDLLIVLNKSDKHSEQERATAKAFTVSVLEKRLGCRIPRVYEVSAQQRLDNLERREPFEEIAQRNCTTEARDWDQLVTALETLAAQSGRDLSTQSAHRGLLRLQVELLGTIAEQRDALLRPIEASESRIARLRQTIAEGELSLADVAYLLTAEERRRPMPC